MKKILALVLAVMMLTICASAVHSDDTLTVWRAGDENEDIAMSFDTFFIDGESMMSILGVADGGAHNVITENPITMEADGTITCRGWFGVKANEEFNMTYGYKINEGEVVYSEDFYNDRADVQAAIGTFADGFEVEIPVKAGEPQLITVVAKDADGSVYDFIEFSINGAYTAAAPAAAEAPAAETPATAEAPAATAPAAAQTADLAVVAIIALGAVAVAKKH